jgi:hypothetical protein
VVKSTSMRVSLTVNPVQDLSLGSARTIDNRIVNKNDNDGVHGRFLPRV